MTIAARKTYDDIIDKLKDLNEQQLSAIHTIIVGLVSNDYVSPLDIRTEEQLWKHINHSVHQADAGVGEDADAVIDELQQEFTA